MLAHVRQVAELWVAHLSAEGSQGRLRALPTSELRRIDLSLWGIYCLSSGRLVSRCHFVEGHIADRSAGPLFLVHSPALVRHPPAATQRPYTAVMKRPTALPARTSPLAPAHAARIRRSSMSDALNPSSHAVRPAAISSPAVSIGATRHVTSRVTASAVTALRSAGSQSGSAGTRACRHVTLPPSAPSPTRAAPSSIRNAPAETSVIGQRAAPARPRRRVGSSYSSSATRSAWSNSGMRGWRRRWVLKEQKAGQEEGRTSSGAQSSRRSPRGIGRLSRW